MTRPAVLIADDHQVIRAAVREALENGGCDVCAETDNAHDAVRLATELLPDACLLDVQMPGGGLWAARVIVRDMPDCRVIMLTVSESALDLYDALDAGAVGYLLKSVSPDEVPAAVHATLAGEAALSGNLTAEVLKEFRRGRGRHEVTNTEGHRVRFTPREDEVIDLLLGGMSTAEIAARLYVRPITVRRHIADAMRKLRVTSRADALALIREQQRIDIPAPPPGS